MFAMTTYLGGNGTGVPFGGTPCDPAILLARVRQDGAAVAGDPSTRRAGVQQLN